MCYACGTELGEGEGTGGGKAREKDEDEAEEEAESADEEEIACPSCGTIISADATMCYACGAEISGGEEGGEAPKKAAKPVTRVKKVVKKKKVL
jgi:hypothetical protein